MEKIIRIGGHDVKANSASCDFVVDTQIKGITFGKACISGSKLYTMIEDADSVEEGTEPEALADGKMAILYMDGITINVWWRDNDDELLKAQRRMDDLYRVVIPKILRAPLDLQPGDLLNFYQDEDSIIIKKAREEE